MDSEKGHVRHSTSSVTPQGGEGVSLSVRVAKSSQNVNSEPSGGSRIG